MEGSGVCVACGAGSELNEENKCPGCADGAAEMGGDMPAAEAPAEDGMEAPAEGGMEAPTEGGEEAAPEMPAEGGEM
jgi:hypothetical protein